MRFEIIPALKADRLALIVARIEAAGLDAEFWLMTGSPPGTAGGTTAEAVQCVIGIPRDSVTVAGGTLTFPANVQGTRVLGASIAWGRLVDGVGAVWADFDVSTTLGSGALKLNSVTGASGSIVRITSAVLTE